MKTYYLVINSDGIVLSLQDSKDNANDLLSMGKSLWDETWCIEAHLLNHIPDFLYKDEEESDIITVNGIKYKRID